MRIEFLMEEYSMEVTLRNILPRILGERVEYFLRVFHGKSDLLFQLPKRLMAYRKFFPENGRIVVLVDQDQQQCLDLKARLEETAWKAGFITKSRALPQDRFEVVNRLAIEELESWFFGDPEALVRAFPRVPPTIGSQAPYRNPDSIAGGTWEALERVLQKAGYYPGGMPKIETARKISEHMDPSRNRSKSFQVFRDALLELSSLTEK